jgi:hypothetical protein
VTGWGFLLRRVLIDDRNGMLHSTPVLELPQLGANRR